MFKKDIKNILDNLLNDSFKSTFYRYKFKRRNFTKINYKNNHILVKNRKNKIKITDSYLKRNYGISLENYENLLIKQDFKCLICNLKNDKTLCVDHNHNNKEVRGLLCRKCNSALGLFEDNIKNLKQAIIYLEKTSSYSS